MTLSLLDVASWQGDLLPADVARSGFDVVNLKTSHGLSDLHVHPDIGRWILESRQLGLALSSFHWLTGGASGDTQAVYAFNRLAQLGLLVGTAHFVDVEDDTVTLNHVRSYITRMDQLLGRPIGLYTGDWWWMPRGWNVSALTPYLMAATNAGYPGSYPGDGSPSWAAGWGGWPVLSVMQHSVKPLPGGTIKVSQSAIRDPAVWAALTGRRPDMSFAPATLSSARNLWLGEIPPMNPLSMGIVGDDSHAASGTSYHLGKDALLSTAYSIVESSRDRNGLSNAASALDIGNFSISRGGKTHTLRTFSVWLVGQCEAGTPDTADIREVIYSPDGQVVKRWDRLKKRTTGPSSHLTHTHVSYFRDSESRDKTALYRRYFATIEGDEPMTPAERAVLIKEMWASQPWGSSPATAGIALQEAWRAARSADAKATDILTNMDPAALAAAMTGPIAERVAAAVIAALPAGALTKADVQAATKAGVIEVLREGTEAPA